MTHWTSSKLKSCLVKDTTKRMKSEATDVEKISADKSHNQQRTFIQNVVKKFKKKPLETQ